GLPRPRPELNFSGIQTLPDHYEQEERSTSWMGTPIIFPSIFLGDSYMRYKPTGEIEKVQRADFELPATTMFSFRRAKNITRTELPGASGTVKEVYGFDDWIIDVRGIALDEPTRSAA